MPYVSSTDALKISFDFERYIAEFNIKHLTQIYLFMDNIKNKLLLTYCVDVDHMLYNTKKNTITRNYIYRIIYESQIILLKNMDKLDKLSDVSLLDNIFVKYILTYLYHIAKNDVICIDDYYLTKYRYIYVLYVYFSLINYYETIASRQDTNLNTHITIFFCKFVNSHIDIIHNHQDELYSYRCISKNNPYIFKPILNTDIDKKLSIISNYEIKQSTTKSLLHDKNDKESDIIIKKKSKCCTI
jgi:hypothetical protein